MSIADTDNWETDAMAFLTKLTIVAAKRIISQSPEENCSVFSATAALLVLSWQIPQQTTLRQKALAIDRTKSLVEHS